MFVPKAHVEVTKSIEKASDYCSKSASRVMGPFTYPDKHAGYQKCCSFKFDTAEPWQRLVIDIIQTEPDDRTIHWFWSEEGKKGKSLLCKFLYLNFGAIVLGNKTNDALYLAKRYPQANCFLFDFPRTSLEYINYGLIENLKNGLFFSGKYESEMVCRPSPHIFCFANTPPKWKDMSLDRWKVYNVDSVEAVLTPTPTSEQLASLAHSSYQSCYLRD